MYPVLFVALGGALGATARYGAYLLVARLWEVALPVATWTVNLTGCLLIGVLVPVLGRGGLPSDLQYFLVVGFLGSLTTFSTFSLETMVFWENGMLLATLVNAVGSVVLGLIFVWLGLQLGRVLV